MVMAMKKPSHPGELVKANLDELGISIADAAKLLGITHQQLCDVVNGESAVSPELAIRFEKAFGGSASMWLRLQAAYDLAQARKKIENINIPPVARAASLPT